MAGVPDRTLTWRQIAAAAYSGRVPRGELRRRQKGLYPPAAVAGPDGGPAVGRPVDRVRPVPLRRGPVVLGGQGVGPERVVLERQGKGWTLPGGRSRTYRMPTTSSSGGTHRRSSLRVMRGNTLLLA